MQWHDPHPEPVLGRLGTLEIRLATSPHDVRLAQKLRYNVFFKEMDARPSLLSRLTRRDRDGFDSVCDHLLVRDTSNGLLGKASRIVGTTRLLRHDMALNGSGFYSTQEFDISPLLRQWPEGRFLELGRSCIANHYRNKRTVELLWHGIWKYALYYRSSLMFGCASLQGTDPEALALQLSYLYHFHRAPEEWRVKAVRGEGIAMDRISRNHIDMRKVLRLLPPLLRGYLRLGAYVADEAVVDHQFGTTDVLIILPVSELNPRYVNYYGAEGDRHAITESL